MELADIARRIGGDYSNEDGQEKITLPCFNKTFIITGKGVADAAGRPLSRNEQTFVYIHMAQGGSKEPTGTMKSLKEFPNTVSKISSMRAHIEAPLKKTFSGHPDRLARACEGFGGENVKAGYQAPDLAYKFSAFPKVPVVLLFWDEKDGFEADAKLLFDETIILHLDIESIMFLSEHLANSLMEAK